MANCCFGICCTPTVLDDAHKHPLELKTDNTTLYRCAGCKEIGFGSFYQCGRRSCSKFKLHEECGNLSSGDSTTHSLFFKNVEFKFQKQPPKTVGSCVACGMSVQGFRYHYCPRKKNAFGEFFFPTKELVLHPCCFRLPRNRTTQGLSTNKGVITNLELKEKAPSQCLICLKKKISKKIKGWAYVSTCGNEYCYHVKCVKELLDKKFDQQSDHGTNTTTRSLLLKVTQKAVKVGEHITVVLIVIIQALYGDPISAMVTLVMHFFNERNFLGQKRLTAG